MSSSSFLFSRIFFFRRQIFLRTRAFGVRAGMGASLGGKLRRGGAWLPNSSQPPLADAPPVEVRGGGADAIFLREGTLHLFLCHVGCLCSAEVGARAHEAWQKPSLRASLAKRLPPANGPWHHHANLFCSWKHRKLTAQHPRMAALLLFGASGGL